MKRLHKRQKLIGKQTISQTSKLQYPPNHNNEATHPTQHFLRKLSTLCTFVYTLIDFQQLTQCI